MPEHRNVQRIRDSYAALAAGDLTSALKDLAPAGVIHFNGSGPLGGDHMGVDNIKIALVRGYTLTGGTLRYHISNIYADDHHGVVVLRQTAARADGAALDIHGVHLIAFDEEGRMTELWDLNSDPESQVRFYEEE